MHSNPQSNAAKPLLAPADIARFRRIRWEQSVGTQAPSEQVHVAFLSIKLQLAPRVRRCAPVRRPTTFRFEVAGNIL